MTAWIERLHERTRAGEQRVAATSWCVALRTSTLDVVRYVGWLRAWEILYEGVEAALGRTADARLLRVWPEPQWRLAVLQRSLAAFDARALPESPRAQLEAMLVVQQLRRAALAEPVTLLGALYGLHLASGVATADEHVARSLDVPHRALEFWAHVRATPGVDLAARLHAAALDEPSQERVITAAVEMLDRLALVLGTLHPLVKDPTRRLVDQLNPEAGGHPITDDLRELHVALCTGAESWQEFPYYEARYGARGLRFTHSDSAWLVELCHHEAAHVHKQVGWLGRMLAPRGMPRLMLEEHLELLHARLCEALPERSERYAVLRAAAHVLRDARRERLPQDEHDALAREFEPRVGSDERARLPRIGDLLVAAVADERDGIAGAVASLAGWLTDPARFGPSWIAAVQSTIERAQAASGSRAARRSPSRMEPR